jgi:glycosidase
MKPFARHSAVAVLVLSALFPSGVFLPSARAEAILQCFNLSHNEIAARIPEIAEAGYSALWIPPPTKANGGMSVGYDLFDPFDIGSTDLRGQYPTRYGTKADLLNLIDVAHRFGMRVYFDNVMNHRAYDVPGYNENTPVDVYPGMVAEDFHLRVTSDGYYRKWDNIDWNNFSEWDVMYRPLSDLIDIAHENLTRDGDNRPFNGNFGPGYEMGQWYPKPYIVRHAYRKEDTWKLFDRMPVPWKSNEDYTVGDGALQNTDPDNGVNLYTGFGNSAWNPEDPATKALLEEHAAWFAKNDASNGVSMTLIENYPNFYKEKVDDYLNRAVRWLVDATHVDGLRLDAVKHVPYEFFGDAYGADKDSSSYGYIGQAQWQFNMTRGFNDWTNHRNTVFSNDGPRDDLMVFGEHLAAPPAQGPYIDAGMRLVDSDLRSALDDAFKFNQLWGFEYPGHAGFGPDHGIMHAQSHDDDHVDRKQLHHAYYYMRSGLGLVYTDGNNRAPELSGSGGAFPRWACTDYLGQWGESQIPTLLKVHENFAMYSDTACPIDYQPGNFIAWERGGGWPWNRVLVMFNSHRDDGQTIWTGGSYPDGDYLYNYASTYPGYMTHWEGGTDDAPYATAGDLRAGKVWMPKNSYALWGYKNPDPSEYWAAAVRDADFAAGCSNTSRSGLSDVITVYDDGQVAPVCGVVRTDGVDGDPGFNPNGVEDADPTDFSYTMAIPVVRGTNVAFGIHLDGEAGHVMARLDGGMDFGNGIEGTRSDIEGDEAKDPRDNPPGAARDCFLGFENIDSYFIQRTWAEVFAAKDTHTTDHGCVLRSGDATTYEAVISGASRIWTNSQGIAFNTALKNPSFLYHDPEATGTYRDTTAESSSRRAAASAGMTCTDHAGETGDWPAGAIDGFREWQFDVYGTEIEGNYAGCYVESPADAGIAGFDGVAYELYANPTNSCGVTVTRWLDLAEGAAVSKFSITLGLNYDSGIDGSYRGFELLDSSGGKIFSIQMGHSPDIYWEGGEGGGTWSEGYPEEGKPQTFRVSLSRTETGYAVSGTTRGGGDFAGAAFASSREIAGYKVYMNGSQSGKESQVYFNDATYTAMEGTPSGGGEEPPGTDVTFPQFSLEGGHPVVYAKMAHGDGLAAWLYYTTNGAWPNGCAGKSPDRNVSVVRGEWVGNQWEQDKDTGEWKITGDWWRFTLPALPGGTVLKYKIGGAALQGDTEKGYQGWETVWPGSADAVWRKTKITGEWRVPREGGLDLTKQQYHKHLDYASKTTGFDEGFHLFTVRCWPDRKNGAEIFNTFRQTFYMDRETPHGILLYPAKDYDEVGGASYGMSVRTDRTVEKVYYHITDASPANDGPGNGVNTNGAVEWAEATLASAWDEDMATNTALPKVWTFNYNGVAPSNTPATIRVRLWEWSSVPTNRWDPHSPTNDRPEALHVTEIVRPVRANGETKYVYYSWPEADNEMVQAGWKVWVRFSGNLFNWDIDPANPGNVYAKAHVYVTNNAAAGGIGDEVHGVEWSDLSWASGGECQMAFAMPNVYTRDDASRYRLTVAIDTDFGHAEASRTIRHKGPAQPACIIATPPETDSDGVKWVISMEDVPPAALATNQSLRETPVIVHTDLSVTNVTVQFTGAPDGAAPRLESTGVTTNGSVLFWNWVWTVDKPGSYAFTATATADPALDPKLTLFTNTAARNATILFQQKCDTTDASDGDWDDDGIPNATELTRTPLPTRGDEQWTQDEVFAYHVSGRTDNASPDTDGDGLPDGLELGVRWPADGTDAGTDTNGDGWPNFLADFDPPFFNTVDNAERVPGVSAKGTGADRKTIVLGTVTDPRNADTDYDGLPDGVEDANRNGWVDGDGSSLPPGTPQDYNRNRPNGLADGGEIWQETSPNVADSDGDGLSDGYGEDTNRNGRVDIFLKYENDVLAEVNLASNQWAVYRAVQSPHSGAVNWKKLFDDYAVNGRYDGEVQKKNGGWPHLIVTETDPLSKDTDGDGLPDGWEVRYGLDPLDNGVYDFKTGLAGDPGNGPDGNPDEDYLADGTTPRTNLLEFQSGTNPKVPDTVENPGGEGSIVIGEGAEIGQVNETRYHREFLDWTLGDLLALDNYSQEGNVSDVYRKFNDGFDSSRDIVAFYFHDGGLPEKGGDGKLYFRVDFDDLAGGAEKGHLDLYVAINVGIYGEGELNLPDNVDARTAMGWNAVCAVYESSLCNLILDTDPEHNTTAIGQSFDGMGIVTNALDGAYFNTNLDCVAWSVDRSALALAGWDGDPDSLSFQVYTTKDGTQNDPRGEGDKSGLNDFTDTIGDDWLCSDYGNDKSYIAEHGVYSNCIGRTKGWNNRGQHAKLALVAHGNQAIEAGSTIQAIVDNGAGAGYQRPVKIHNIYTNCPLNLHITPTLAMALEWAKTGTDKPWFSGPALNAQIRSGIAAGSLSLLGSTYSDHILPYFPPEFNRANVALANDVLDTIYGGTNGAPVVSRKVFWAPERVVDTGVLDQIGTMGYQATIVDQTPHLLDWFGRETALGDSGYKLQRYWLADQGKEMKAFVLSTAANDSRYVNTDGGLPTDLRHLFLRRARSGQAAISSIFYMWEELAGNANADAYDRNLRWIANHPWIQVVTLDRALEDPSVTNNMFYPDGSHNFTAETPLEAHDWVHHACNENYGNWYFGSDRHEGLAWKTNEVRYGILLPSGKPFGTATNGILAETWATVSAISNPDVKRLAEATLFASVFETAFHEEENGNLSRWSYNDYIYPATGMKEGGGKMGLQSFSWRAQSRTRLANVYGEVDAWAGRTLSKVEVLSKDVDLDGENEWILRNNKLMALFETEGGLMIGAWLKDGERVRQVVGNFAAIPENGYEDEESDFVRYVKWDDETWHGYLAAQRGSALKDVEGGSRTALYDVVPGTNGLAFKHGSLAKTVSLASPATNAFAVSYTGSGTLKVRSGLSPDLDALMLTGQANMTETSDASKKLSVTTIRPAEGTGVTATLDVTRGAIDTAATDRPVNVPEEFNTVNMRNAAHVRQVDVTGSGSIDFTLAFTVEDTENLPPVLAVNPDNAPQVFPVGTTTSFSVEATDPDSANVTVSCGPLPKAGNTLASFSGATHVFSWTPSPLSQGTRTEDFRTNVTFTATDGLSTTSRTVSLVIPWDSDADGLPDDWEYLRFGTLAQHAGSDWDRDEFPDWNEYVAGTSPTDPFDYIGWESLFVDTAAGTAELTFLSVPGKRYAIEASDGAAALVSPAWKALAVLEASSPRTTWQDTDPASATRMYRIRVLFP